MIYFLINNNYHLDMDLKLAKDLIGFKLGLIQNPYSLNVVEESDVFSNIYIFPNRIIPSILGFLKNPLKIFSIQKEVDKLINPDSNDILLVHTDMDLLNQYIIQKFYKVGAKVYLLEDGIATVCSLNVVPKKAQLKDRIKTIILKRLYKFKYSKIAVYGEYTIPVMEDSLFNGVIVNYGDSILRNIPFYKLTPKNEPFEVLYDRGALFLSQALYFWYLSENEYIDYIKDLLIISKKFDPFYFKFHPSDSEFVKTSIIELIDKKYKNIEIISENDIAENLINKYPVKYTISFNSTASLNVMNKGVIPIYLNNLFNSIYPNSNFKSFEQFLDTIKCNSPKKISEIEPGFRAFSNHTDVNDSKTLINILNLKDD